MSRNFLVYGASKGLGKAIIESIPSEQDTAFAVARNPSETRNKNIKWILADLSKTIESVTQVTETIQNESIDCLIYNVGIWESTAFSDEYDFEAMSQQEILNMVQVNISACLLHIQALLPNLKKANQAKIILIGSTWGLDNHNGCEVVFSASKYALRGIAQSLRENLRNDKIGVSVLNLGYLATEYPIEVPTETVITETEGTLIPLQDVMSAIQFILSTSNATCVKEIDMPAMLDTNV